MPTPRPINPDAATEYDLDAIPVPAPSNADLWRVASDLLWLGVLALGSTLFLLLSQ